MTYSYLFGKVIGTPVSNYILGDALEKAVENTDDFFFLCQPEPVINTDYSCAYILRILGWTLFHLLGEWQIRSYS